jgi:Leucine-rich repeat (LRR) protein
LPPEIAGLVQLQKLYLSRNQLASLPPEIGGLTQLQTLYLYENQLTSLPVSIINLQNSLVLLRLIDNPIMETGTDGNLGRRELELYFGDRVLFESVQRSKDFKRISKEDAIRNALAQPLHWNLKKLKELVNNRLPKGDFTEKQMLQE